jgi:hypothetical protein
MSQEDVELVREALERLLRTGEPAWDVIHEEVEVHDHDIPDASEYKGLSRKAVALGRTWRRPWPCAE